MKLSIIVPCYNEEKNVFLIHDAINKIFKKIKIKYEIIFVNDGSTKGSIRKLFKYAFDGIISFTTAPLRFATYTGLLSTLASFIYIIVIIVQKLAFDSSPPGYASTVVLLLFFGGIQLFSLGIIGEYLGRVYIETKKRPIYIAKEIRKSGKK